MKKLIVKTALITFCVALVVAVSAFGIVSLAAPSVMMRFCDSLGMETISADYAYQNYQLKGDIDSLARSFEIAASSNNDAVAVDRFEEFYGEDDSEQRVVFATYCRQQDEAQASESMPADLSEYGYRSVVCAKAAVARYHIAESEEEKISVCEFATRESHFELSAESPVVVLAAECVSKDDAAFCLLLHDSIASNAKFNKENSTYLQIMKSLEETSHE